MVGVLAMVSSRLKKTQQILQAQATTVNQVWMGAVRAGRTAMIGAALGCGMSVIEGEAEVAGVDINES